MKARTIRSTEVDKKHRPVADDPDTSEHETTAGEKGMIETPEMQDASKVTETPVAPHVPQAMQNQIDAAPVDALDVAAASLRKQAENYRILNSHDMVGIANAIVAAVRATSAKPDKLDKPKR